MLQAEGEPVNEDELPEPHKLHAVYRTHRLSGRPYWEKEAMEKLGLKDIEVDNGLCSKGKEY